MPDVQVAGRLTKSACALVCATNYVRCAHIEGGEVSGTIDELFRHCNTKLAYCHFVSSEAAARRVMTLGEPAEAVHAIGSPELDFHSRPSGVGLAEVKEVFSSPKLGDIAGCIVVDGVVRRSSPIRVLRDNVVIYEGELESLRRFKDDVSEVRSGTECGIGVKDYDNVQVGDQIECFERIEVARTLD